MYKSSNFLNIQNSFDKKNNSHSYMFYTNDFLSCKNDLEELVKHIFKNDNLISLENDYVVIKRSEKKNILKDDMMDLKNFFLNTSYINEFRVYLVEEAHKLNSSSANMILKFLEEPMDGVIAFFITTNLDSVLPTIKSRTQIVNVFYDKTIEECFDIDILLNFLKKDKYFALFGAKEYFKKYDRNMLIELFISYLTYCYKDINDDEKLKKIKKVNRVISMLNNNVNVDYVFDYLFLGGE